MARKVGEAMGPFGLVITSTLPRAFQTAIAMGFAVQEQREEFCPFDDDINEALFYPAPFARWVPHIKEHKQLAQCVKEQSDLLHVIVAQLDEGDSALVVSHGGVVEVGAVGCMPQFDWAQAGDAMSYCEGVRLAFDGVRFVKAEVLRVKN